MELAKAFVTVRADASRLRPDLMVAQKAVRDSLAKMQQLQNKAATLRQEKQLKGKTGDSRQDTLAIQKIDNEIRARRQLAAANKLNSKQLAEQDKFLLNLSKKKTKIIIDGIRRRHKAAQGAEKSRIAAAKQVAKKIILGIRRVHKVALAVDKSELVAKTAKTKKIIAGIKRVHKAALVAAAAIAAAEKVASALKVRRQKKELALTLSMIRRQKKARADAERASSRRKAQAIRMQQKLERAAERRKLQGIRTRDKAERASERKRMRGIREARKAFRGLSLFMSAGLGALSGFGAGIIGGSIKAAGGFEQLTVSLETMLGGADAAQAKILELQSFAAKTPFTIPGVEDAARSLLAVGFTADELLPTLKSLGDVSSGLGRGEDGLRRLILNMGQVRAQAKLTGRELRDFAILGVPIIEELGKVLGKSAAEIQQLTQAGKISSADVSEAFRRMSSAGGRFANLMEKQNKTMLGLFSNLKDEIIISARTLGNAFLPKTRELISRLILLARQMRIVIVDSDGLASSMLLGASAATTLAAGITTVVVAAQFLGITLRGLFIGTAIIAAIVGIGTAIGAFVNNLMKSASSMKRVIKISLKLELIWIQLQNTAKAAFTAINEIFQAVFGVGFQDVVKMFTDGLFNAIDAIAEFALDMAEWAQVINEHWRGLWNELPKILKAGGSFMLDVLKNVLIALKDMWLFRWSFMADILKNLVTKVYPQLIGFGLKKMFDLVVKFGKQLPKLWVAIWSSLPDPKKILTALATAGPARAVAIADALGIDAGKAVDEIANRINDGFVNDRLPDMDEVLKPSDRTLGLLDKAKKSISGILKPSERTKKLLSEIDVFKDIIAAKKELEKNRALPAREAPKPKEEDVIEQGKTFGKAAAIEMKFERSGFLEFGQKIQDALIKRDVDKGVDKTNLLLGQVNSKLQVQIDQQKGAPKPGLGP